MDTFGQVEKVLIAAAAVFFAFSSRADGSTLVWDSNTEEDLGGYHIYISDKTNALPAIDVGKTNFFSLGDIGSTATVWIYVTAYNTNNFESERSAVLQYPNAAECEYAVHPQSGYAGPWPSTGHLRVTTATGCSWRAISNNDWIQLKTSEGFGMTDLEYSVAQNTDPWPRQGSITVADQTFTVYQTAAGVMPQVLGHLAGNISVDEGQTLQLRVDATDISELRYQWFRNGLTISGATNSELRIASILPEDAGKYVVSVSSAVQTLIDGPAELEVYAKPRITESGQPKDIATLTGASVFFSVNATGPDLHYAWKRDGIRVGVDLPMFYLGSVSASDAGMYRVTVSNRIGEVESAPAKLVLGTPQQIGGEILIQSANANSVLVQAQGVPGEAYDVQGSLDLVQWFTVQSVLVDSSGRFLIAVPAPVSVDRWFVRTVRQVQAQPAP